MCIRQCLRRIFSIISIVLIESYFHNPFVFYYYYHYMSPARRHHWGCVVKAVNSFLDAVKFCPPRLRVKVSLGVIHVLSSTNEP